jgi:gamma-glutamylputrescine oxidase
MPVNNYIIATEPMPAEIARSLISEDIAVADSKFVVNYFRFSADNRLLFGGRESYGYRFPADIKPFVRKAMIDIFPQTNEMGIDYGWGGTLAITMTRLPYLRALGRRLWNASGYSGHGVAMATMSGKIIADAIVGQTGDFDVMSRIKAPAFPGGTRFRNPLLVAAMLWYSLRDRL